MSEEKLIKDWSTLRHINWLDVSNPVGWWRTLTKLSRVEKEYVYFIPTELRNRRRILSNQLLVSLIVFLLVSLGLAFGLEYLIAYVF